MRLPTFFLLLLGLGACVATGWVVWKATAETRAWREMITLSKNRSRTMAEEQRFNQLVRKRLPGESPRRWAIWVESVNDPRRQIIVTAPGESRESGDTLFQIHVFDADYRRISSTLASPGVGQRSVVCRKGDRTDLGPTHFQVECSLPLAKGAVEKITQHCVLINDA